MVGPSQHDNAVNNAPQFSTTCASEQNTYEPTMANVIVAILHLLQRCPG
jgi:hypothetical protein